MDAVLVLRPAGILRAARAWSEPWKPVENQLQIGRFWASGERVQTSGRGLANGGRGLGRLAAHGQQSSFLWNRRGFSCGEAEDSASGCAGAAQRQQQHGMAAAAWHGSSTLELGWPGRAGMGIGVGEGRVGQGMGMGMGMGQGCWQGSIISEEVLCAGKKEQAHSALRRSRFCLS